MIPHDESTESLRRVLDKLSKKQSRLITLSDEHGHTQAEITHEALLDHWTLLKDWLATSRNHLRFADRLNEAIEHWQQHKRAKALLWSLSPDFDLLKAFQKEVTLSKAQMEFYREARARRHAQKRVKIGLAAFLLLLTLTSTGAAWWAWRAEDRAVKQKDLALEAINAMTYGLADRLRPLAGNTMIVKDILTKNMQLLDRISALEPNLSEALWEKASNLDRAGDLWLQLGDTQAALENYRQSQRILEKLANKNPDNAVAQRDLSVSYNKLGDLRPRLGDTQAALENYEKGLKIAEKLANKNPDNAVAQRDLSVSYNKLGDVRPRLGETQAALENYAQSLKIREMLTKKDPDNAARNATSQ